MLDQSAVKLIFRPGVHIKHILHRAPNRPGTFSSLNPSIESQRRVPDSTDHGFLFCKFSFIRSNSTIAQHLSPCMSMLLVIHTHCGMLYMFQVLSTKLRTEKP